MNDIKRGSIVWRGYGMAHAWKQNGLGHTQTEALCGVFADPRDRPMGRNEPQCPNCTGRFDHWRTA